MTDSRRLLADLRKLLVQLEADLCARADTLEEIGAVLRAEYAAARRVGRTADAYETWREEPITQAAVAWVLGTVFVRFLEDTWLIEPWLSGPAERRRRALDRHALYFQQHPTESDREYLQHVFRKVGELPAGRDVFDARHNPLWQLPISGDAAKTLLEFWQRLDPATGEIAHEFADPTWDTRFLGDLYQDLSEPARQKYALLQTPRFVEAFILDRTLTPAIDTFGYRDVRLIDPTCGSGHFLLGAFDRLLALWQRDEPGTNVRVLVQRVLAQVAGVDLNPFAAAIARFRLLVAALQACGITRLADAPAFQIDVAVGDSLLHGRRFAEEGAVQQPLDPDDPAHHHFAVEDAEAIDRILGRQYHAVVGNPPYITVKDRALNQLYRQRYGSCHMKYSLVVPFLERFFELALPGKEVGYVGLIVANSFMKREFGKKLIEKYLPRWHLTHVVNTSEVYFPPSHGATPTVILFGRHRRPTGKTRTVMGIRGEPTTPDDPTRGQVWSAILAQIDLVDSESAFVSVRDLEQSTFHTHPWSIGGGGAAELKELLDQQAEKTLGEIADSIGITSFTLEDDLFLLPLEAARRSRIEPNLLREMIVGDAIRDWSAAPCDVAVFPYGPSFELVTLSSHRGTQRYLWLGRTCLANNKMFGGKTKIQSGLQWFEFGRLTADKLRTPLSIAFAFVATHNHFVLDRGRKVFNRSAPVIKFPPDATEDDHFALLGLLNSSTACFWMKQVFYPKATISGDISLEKGKPEANRFEFTGTGLLAFPVPVELSSSRTRLVRQLSVALTQTAARADGLQRAWTDGVPKGPECVRAAIDQASVQHAGLQRHMVALQEELDWEVYSLFGLSTEGADSSVLDAVTQVQMDWRPFLWQTDEPPAGQDVPPWYKRRRQLISTDPQLACIETPVYKRLWLGRQGVYGHASRTFRERCYDALRQWLLDRLEADRYWPSTAALQTTEKLADVARHDTEFMTVAEVYRGRADFDVTALVTELVLDEAVPFLPVLRYTESGMRKRALWERTWDLQRREDAIDARVDLPDGDPAKLTPARATALNAREVGEIPVPPKYASADFRKGNYWRLRGKLDVPKERFSVYPGAERATDPTPVVAWAGWDHLQQAQALSAYYVRMQEQEGWPAERLLPLVAGLLELVPWLRQWHNAVDPTYGQGMGDYFGGFVEEEARRLGLTLDAVRAWQPPSQSAAVARRGRRSRAVPSSAAQAPPPRTR